MNREQAKKMLKAKLECLKRETSGTDFDCNNSNCDECSLCYEQGNMGEQKEALDMAIKALEQQPCENTISRQAAIDAVKKHYWTHDNDLLELIAFDIERLPPAQETHEERTETHACDLISRQAAIEYLMTNMNWYDEDGYESDDDYKRECITELINGVPSAQPYTEAELQKIQELEQAELEKAFELGKAEANKWIPCDKGEPDEDTECWVTVKTTDVLYRGYFTKRYGERRNKGFITSDGFMWWNTALAWMPIYEPEPYNAESEDEDK